MPLTSPQSKLEATFTLDKVSELGGSSHPGMNPWLRLSAESVSPTNAKISTNFISI